MAVVHPLTTLQQVWAQKIETTTGTAISLSASDGTQNVFEPAITPDIPYKERRGQGPSYGRIKGTAGARGANVSFKYELHGTNGTPLQLDTLKAAGFSVTSLTATKVSGSATADTLTVGHYRDGSRFKSAAGCMFNLKMTGVQGEPVMVEATGKGVWQAPSTVAMIAPTYITTIPPVLVSAVFTVGATAYTIPGFELDCGNNVILRPSINSAAGFIAAYITDHAPTFTISPEALALGTKDWYADYVSGATAALSIVVGGSANNTVTITAPALQLISGIEDEDRDGVLADKLVFGLNKSAAAGDDELVIAYS
jgi:hypothetical protein